MWGLEINKYRRETNERKKTWADMFRKLDIVQYSKIRGVNKA